MKRGKQPRDLWTARINQKKHSFWGKLGWIDQLPRWRGTHHAVPPPAGPQNKIISRIVTGFLATGNRQIITKSYAFGDCALTLKRLIGSVG
jgi:hypothetical protein